MPKLACFGDEIGAAIDLQIEHMLAQGVRALELRGAEGSGVLDLDGEVRATVRAKLADAGIEVFSIGSPLGKVQVTAPLADELARTRRAIEQARFFGAPRIRIFSFYIPERRYDDYRGLVMDGLAAMADLAEQAGVLLCHENEGGIYGESVERCADIFNTVDSPALKAVHDTCNFLHGGHEAFPAGLEAMRARLEYLHIKDWGAGAVQPCGEGEGRMPELFARLKAEGWDGYVSLEPHIGGGPENFKRAADALKRRLDEVGWAYC